MKFKKLGLIEPILKSIEEQGFDSPTTIQEKSIPLILEGKDVIGGSATGSGKTLAFGSGIIQNLNGQQGIKSLILTPTRELAEQVRDSLRMFSKYKRLNIISVYGGVSITPQFDALKKADVVVGTPGRILDHLERRSIDLRNVKILVLDEADRMLDMGFIEDVEKIISQCSRDRQTLLFSATISTEIKRLTHKYMNNPIKISAEVHVDPTKLKQIYYEVDNRLKFSLLVHLLKNENSGLVMVFCNTRNNVDFVDRNLRGNGVNSIAIHGGFSQAKRLNTIKKFHSIKTGVLVCTDVAARGLDIPNVSHVYNYDIPRDSKEYVHRVGRTARAGSEGIVINILCDRDHENFSRVMSDYREMKIEKEQAPQVERVFIKKDFRDGGNQRGGFNRGGSRGGYNSRRPRSGGYGSNRGRSGGSYGFKKSEGSGRSQGNRFGSNRSEGNNSNRSGPKRFGNSNRSGRKPNYQRRDRN